MVGFGGVFPTPVKPLGVPVGVTIGATGVLILTVYLFMRYGECDFEGIVYHGPYAVGCRSFYCSKSGCPVSVYYPVDKALYEASGAQRKKWLDHNENDRWIKQLCKTISWYKNKPEGSSFIFWPWREIYTQAKVGVQLAYVFAHGKKKMAPILFSHGFCGNRCMYSVIMQELASFGYIVFGLDHLDGSGNYTLLQGNKCMVFNTDMDRSKFSPG